jgi:F0F1-type ATP synthase membrane subunit b/b'
MPSVSEKQRKFFQLIKAIQEGRATDASDRAKAVAKSMTKKDVIDFASTTTESKDESNMKEPNNKSAAGIDKDWLLNAAGVSALLGAGAAGAYGLSKYLSDSYIVPSQISKTKKQLQQVSNYEEEEIEKELDQLLNDSQTDIQPTVTNEDEYLKASASKQAFLGFLPLVPDNDMEWRSLASGVATPLAVAVPALLTYHFTKKLVDRYRNKSFDNKVQKAKEEFEQILSNKTSSLRDQVDSLYFATKQAGAKNVSSGRGGTFLGRPTEGTYAPPPLGTSTTVPKDDVVIGPNLTNEMGLLWLAGAAIGTSGLASYLFLRNKIRDGKDQKKLKALKGLLNKNLTAEALQSGIRIRKDDQGSPIVDI